MHIIKKIKKLQFWGSIHALPLKEKWKIRKKMYFQRNKINL